MIRRRWTAAVLVLVSVLAGGAPARATKPAAPIDPVVASLAVERGLSVAEATRRTGWQERSTDLADALSGRVTKGGSGPCYGLVTDDEVQYALHSTAGITLEEGTYVLVKVAPLRLKIYCGPGQHMALLEATQL